VQQEAQTPFESKRQPVLALGYQVAREHTRGGGGGGGGGTRAMQGVSCVFPNSAVARLRSSAAWAALHALVGDGVLRFLLTRAIALVPVAPAAYVQERPPPPRTTKWTRRVPHPVLIGHADVQHDAAAAQPATLARRGRGPARRSRSLGALSLTARPDGRSPARPSQISCAPGGANGSKCRGGPRRRRPCRARSLRRRLPARRVRRRPGRG
jgi:hypothetical protein